MVGLRYAELDELKAQMAERAAAEEASSEGLKKAARQARNRADETKSMAGDETPQEPEPFVSSPEMKRLYREVAKRIHPDLTSDDLDRSKRQQLMMAANEAYERGDEAQLTRILTEYEFSPEAVKGDGAASELVRAIRRISQARNRIDEVEREIRELTLSDLYQPGSAVERGGKGRKGRAEGNGRQSGGANRRNEETIARPSTQKET